MAPTLILVPGCWHTTAAFATLKAKLASHFDAVDANLPSNGSKGGLGLGDDASFIRASIVEPLLADGKDVVFFTHSYGSVPASQAVQGLENSSKGRGRVLGCIYLAGYLIPEDMSMYEWTLAHRANRDGTNQTDDFIEVSADGAYSSGKNAAEYFYSDVAEDVARELGSRLVPQSIGALGEKVQFAAWSHGDWRMHCRYIFTKRDRTNPLEFQERFVDGKIEGPTLDSSHSPFVSQPDELAGAVERCVGEIVRSWEVDG